MKSRLLLCSALLSASLLLPSLARADDEEHTPLGEQMELIGDAFRDLRRSAGDPERNDESLELLGTMRAAAEKGLAFKPEYTTDKPEGEQAEFVANFKKDMEAFIATIDATAAAIKAGDNAKADELVKEMRSGQRTAHKAYRRPRD